MSDIFLVFWLHHLLTVNQLIQRRSMFFFGFNCESVGMCYCGNVHSDGNSLWTNRHMQLIIYTCSNCFPLRRTLQKTKMCIVYTHTCSMNQMPGSLLQSMLTVEHAHPIPANRMRHRCDVDLDWTPSPITDSWHLNPTARCPITSNHGQIGRSYILMRRIIAL